MGEELTEVEGIIDKEHEEIPKQIFYYHGVYIGNLKHLYLVKLAHVLAWRCSNKETVR